MSKIAAMPSSGTVIRDVDTNITTFSTPFYRFAPFGYRKFGAVGNRATAIKLANHRVLLLNPVPLEPRIRDKLVSLGGVNFVACDLGHHMYVKDYLDAWPNAKAIGVSGLDKKRKDIAWSFIYRDRRASPEKKYNFADDVETVLFEGFITYCVAWYHQSSRTLIQSDLMMNLPCTEQYHPSSAHAGPGSWVFAKAANPMSVWQKRLMYYIATVDVSLMRRDVKKVNNWDIVRIIPCHGDVLESDGNAAWSALYEWDIADSSRVGIVKKLMTPIMKVARRVLLM